MTPDQRRQGHGQGHDGAEHAAAGKLGALEEKRQRHRPRARPATTEATEIQRLRQRAIHSSRRLKNSPEVAQGPLPRSAQGLEQGHEQRIAHQPGEDGGNGERGERGGRFTGFWYGRGVSRFCKTQRSLGNARGAGPRPFGATHTESPTAAAPDGASTSTSPPSASSTWK